jgi:hypothetical protein
VSCRVRTGKSSGQLPGFTPRSFRTTYLWFPHTHQELDHLPQVVRFGALRRPVSGETFSFRLPNPSDDGVTGKGKDTVKTEGIMGKKCLFYWVFWTCFTIRDDSCDICPKRNIKEFRTFSPLAQGFVGSPFDMQLCLPASQRSKYATPDHYPGPDTQADDQTFQALSCNNLQVLQTRHRKLHEDEQFYVREFLSIYHGLRCLALAIP